MSKDVIIVEDDILLRENLCELLRLDGFDVTECSTGKQFLDQIKTIRFKVAIVDIGLPDKSGYEVASHLRKTTNMGIIILTARTGMDNKIQGFSSGADYYFSKPVDSRELTASINNLMCRLSLNDQDDKGIPADAWTFNTNGWLLIAPAGNQVNLTTKESEFISLLQQHGTEGVEKESILKELGYIDQEPYGSRALGVLVARLRKKVKDSVGENGLIQTVHGFGFSLGEKLVRL